MNFQSLYDQRLAAELQALEKRRFDILALMGIAAFFALLAFGLVSYMMNTDGYGYLPPVLFLVAAITSTILFVFSYQRYNGYVKDYKQKLIRQIIQTFHPGFLYSPERFIAEADYRQSGLFLESLSSLDGSDYVEGCQGATCFCFSDLCAESGNGRNSAEVIFRGQFFIADFNKNFSGRTYVWNKFSPQLNFISKFFSQTARGLEKLTLESEEFNRRFDIYSTDQTEARYLLTPAMMDRLLFLYKNVTADISCSFIGTNIYIALPSKIDLFEPTLFKPLKKEVVEFYFNRMENLLGMIEQLNLNTRIWNKP